MTFLSIFAVTERIFKDPLKNWSFFFCKMSWFLRKDLWVSSKSLRIATVIPLMRRLRAISFIPKKNSQRKKVFKEIIREPRDDLCWVKFFSFQDKVMLGNTKWTSGEGKRASFPINFTLLFIFPFSSSVSKSIQIDSDVIFLWVQGLLSYFFQDLFCFPDPQKRRWVGSVVIFFKIPSKSFFPLPLQVPLLNLGWSLWNPRSSTRIPK